MTIKSETWYWEKHWGDFRLGKANLRVEWDGGSADAVLYDEGVPRTVAALVEALPLTVPVVHVAWSGEMVMSSEAYQLGVDVHENRDETGAPRRPLVGPGVRRDRRHVRQRRMPHADGSARGCGLGPACVRPRRARRVVSRASIRRSGRVEARAMITGRIPR